MLFNVIRKVGVRQVLAKGAFTRVTQVRQFSTKSEVDLLEDLLAAARARATAPVVDAQEEEESREKFTVGTYNAISPEGLQKFKANLYETESMTDLLEAGKEPHAILLRSYKLKSEEVPNTIRAVARCGAGTNNIPVEELTQRGIPVFNTPGANANAVKECTICALLLASRGIVEGIKHTEKIFEEESDINVVKKRVEAEKKFFVGQELAGKTLGVVGLGHIGASVANAARELGMNLIGYDPALTVESAWKLPGDVIERAEKLDDLLKKSDYISLHVPYIKDKTHHLISAESLKIMKPTCNIVNFARGELVDSAALARMYQNGTYTGKYVLDFADENLHDSDKVITLPHLGASTAEAENNSASMAAIQMQTFIETGHIKNSVNFPELKLPGPLPYDVGGPGARLCMVNRNEPGVLGRISSKLGDLGVNIRQQINSSRGSIAYTLIDLETINMDEIDKIQQSMGEVDGVLSSRLIEPVKRPSFYVVGDNK